MLQQEANDVRNLALDSIKQNIMPVTKVVRGRNIDLDQLKRRGQGTAIMVQKPDDVTWEKVADIGESKNLAAEKPEVVKELTAKFETWNKTLEEPRWIASARLAGKAEGKKGKKAKANPQ